MGACYSMLDGENSLYVHNPNEKSGSKRGHPIFFNFRVMDTPGIHDPPSKEVLEGGGCTKREKNRGKSDTPQVTSVSGGFRASTWSWVLSYGDPPETQ